MMMLIPALILGALFFAAAAYLGILLGNVFAERIPALPDSPEPHGVPVAWIVGVAAVIGALIATHAAISSQILMDAIICVALSAIFVTDAKRGVVPDVFTIGPLVIILLVGLWQHEWRYFLAAAIPAAPFAIAAVLSKGRGMGWGDVKLVALGGALLGAAPAVLAFALACLCAVAVNYSRGKRKGIIALAPYLASAIAVALPVAMSFR